MKAPGTTPETWRDQPGRQARTLQGLLVKLLEPPGVLNEHPLSDVELSPREVKVLMTLGEKGETIMSDLANTLRVPLSTATRIIDRLNTKQLVDRSRSDQDRRIVVVRPSDKGRSMHEAFKETQLVMAGRMLEPLSSGEREILLELIAKMVHGLTTTRK
jgi:DNA-binding MarR family transcriptional regulator